jgi:2-iminobutanoate/2-iminopropanoate deaminase
MEQCFKNLERTLQAAGVSLETVVKTTVFFKNLEDFQGIRAVHRRVFKYGFPARSALITQFLDPQCLVQIEAVAYRE